MNSPSIDDRLSASALWDDAHRPVLTEALSQKPSEVIARELDLSPLGRDRQVREERMRKVLEIARGQRPQRP